MGSSARLTLYSYVFLARTDDPYPVTPWSPSKGHARASHIPFEIFDRILTPSSAPLVPTAT